MAQLRSFCGAEAENRRCWRNSLLSEERAELRRSPDGARTFRGRPLENVSKMTPMPPVLRGEAFRELRRRPGLFNGCEGTPPVRTLFFGSLAALARGSLAALHLLLSAVGSVFSKIAGLPPS